MRIGRIQLAIDVRLFFSYDELLLSLRVSENHILSTRKKMPRNAGTHHAAHRNSICPSLRGLDHLPTAATITIPETLALLDGSFSLLAQGVAENRYAFWLGSGISFGRVDGLGKVVPRVIEHLRSRVVFGDPHCKFRASLEAALNLAALTDDERRSIDYSQPFSHWSVAASITQRLINQYSRLLQIRVGNEPHDYLLWDGIDIVITFANPAIDPDVEHLCIAILVMEGLSSDIASANWDGLIEKATQTLADNATTLLVCVRPEELQQQPGKAHLFKFHGCAVRAAADQPKYRPFMTGRLSQINRWADDYPAMANRLVALIAGKPTLMIGLSAQDSNIQGIFSKAESYVQWPWPGERPSLIFSASELGVDQSALLENVYRTAYTGADHAAIDTSATFPAYGKPLLLALVLHVLATKLNTLIQGATLPGYTGDDRIQLQSGIGELRGKLADVVDADRMKFIRTFIEQSGKAICMFRTGQVPNLPTRYLPFTTTPVQELSADHAVQTSGLPEAAVAAGVIGLLVKRGKLEVRMSDPTSFGSGALRVESTVSRGKVFFAANGNAALRLRNNGHVNDSDDTILIHSLEIIPSQTRSPRSSPGRTGRSGLREVSISTLIAETASSDELVERFREEVGV
jgi:hypothetical protein